MVYDNCVPFGGSVFRQTRGAQRKPLSVFAVLKCPPESQGRILKGYILRLLRYRRIILGFVSGRAMFIFKANFERGEVQSLRRAPSRSLLKTRAGNTKYFPYYLFPITGMGSTELCSNLSSKVVFYLKYKQEKWVLLPLKCKSQQ